MNPNAAEAAKAAKAAKAAAAAAAAAAVQYYNDLLKQSAKLNTVTVTECMFVNAMSSVFKGVDSTNPEKQIIVKTTNAPWDNQVELPRLQPYVALSERCNICKLLKYEVIGPPSNRKLVTVMENCGVDLFTFMIDYLKTENGKINLNLILSISLDLLNQIICLQSQNAVHGDIKIENVLIDDKDKATLVDFDELPTITQDETGMVRVRDLTVTSYKANEDTFMKLASRYYATTKTETQFIMAILSSSDMELYMDCNIPVGINETRVRSSNNFTLPTRENVNIIDLYSWCYVILILLWVVRNAIDNVFGYRTLLAIVMSILLVNADPKPEPVDVFNIPINADYRRKLVLGITVLVSFLREGTVPNEACTNNKIRLFLKLIQKCTSAEELSSRFKSIVTANSAFYDTNINEADIPAAFVQIDADVDQPLTASAGSRRRRTRAKTHRIPAHKKGKKASQFKRMKHTTKHACANKNIFRKCI
jgi:serine/threonine protein kinase